jgi:hypothetical protein
MTWAVEDRVKGQSQWVVARRGRLQSRETFDQDFTVVREIGFVVNYLRGEFLH